MVKRVALLVPALVLSACVGRRRVSDDPANPPAPREVAGRRADAARLYQQMGLLTETGALPFVGSVAFLSGTTSDTTLLVVTLSLAAQSFSFARENDKFHADYDVRLDLRQGGTLVRHAEAHETIRVGSFKETTRSDETVLFQQTLNALPGEYVLTVSIKDAGSSRTVTHDAVIAVPRLVPDRLSTPLVVYEALPRTRLDELPHVVPAPRATVVFGRDSVVPIYLEAYGGSSSAPRFPISIVARGERGVTLWTDTTSLTRRDGLYSDMLRLPTNRIGVGVSTILFSRTGARDSVSARAFVSFGEDLPVMTYEEMLGYLRYYATSERIRALRDTTAGARAAAWAAFMRQTDPNPSTPQHEGLRDYFNRVSVANDRFREDASGGWASDRGMVYVSLGEPDQVYEQGTTDISQRGRAQIWEYRNYHLQLVFIDQTGFGRWRLTSASEADFRSVLDRVLVH